MSNPKPKFSITADRHSTTWDHNSRVSFPSRNAVYRIGRLRTDAFRTEIQYHLDAGVNGIAVAGSTGEGNALTSDEYAQVCEIAVELIRERSVYENR